MFKAWIEQERTNGEHADYSLWRLVNGESVLERQLRLLYEFGIYDVVMATESDVELKRDICTQERFSSMRISWADASAEEASSVDKAAQSVSKSAVDFDPEGHILIPDDAVFSKSLLECIVNDLSAKPKKEEKASYDLFSAELLSASFIAQSGTPVMLMRCCEAEDISCVNEKLKHFLYFEQILLDDSCRAGKPAEKLAGFRPKRALLIEAPDGQSALAERLLNGFDISYASYALQDGALTLDELKSAAAVFAQNGCDSIVSAPSGAAHMAAKALKLYILSNGSMSLDESITAFKLPHIAFLDVTGTGEELLDAASWRDGAKENAYSHIMLLPEILWFEPRIAGDINTDDAIVTLFMLACDALWYPHISSMESYCAMQAIRAVKSAIAEKENNACQSANLLQSVFYWTYCAIRRGGLSDAARLSHEYAVERGISFAQALLLLAPTAWRYYAEHIMDCKLISRKELASQSAKLMKALELEHTYELPILFFTVFSLKRATLTSAAGMLPRVSFMSPVIPDKEAVFAAADRLSKRESRVAEQPELRPVTVREIRALTVRNLSMDCLDGVLKVQRELFSNVVALIEERSLRYALLKDVLYSYDEKTKLPTLKAFDIVMPRADYDSFISEVGQLLPEGMELYNGDTDSGCWFSHSRICKSGSIYVSKSEMQYEQGEHGIYIQLIPLDEALEKDKNGRRLALLIANGIDRISKCRSMPNAGKRWLGRKGRFIMSVTAAFSNTALRHIQYKLQTRNASKTAELFMLSLDGQEKPFIFDKNCFFNARKKPEKSLAVELESELKTESVDEGGADDDLKYIPLWSDPYKVRFSKDGDTYYFQKLYTIPGKPIGRAKGNLVVRVIKGAISRLKKLLRPVTSIIRILCMNISGAMRTCGIKVSKASKHLASYKNIHAGKRCFLIGNGPSLKAEDLDLLKNEITFGCNFIYRIYDQTSWRPTYYCVSDSSIIKSSCLEILENLANSRLVVRDYAHSFMQRAPKNVLRLPSVSVDWYKVKGNILAFHYISHATIMSMMVELAMYLGCKEIYLIGVDGSGSSSSAGHFAEHYLRDEYKQYGHETKRKNIKDYDPKKQAAYYNNRMLVIYSKLRDFAQKRGVKIYNATRGGYVEVFERKDLDDVIGLK